MLKRVVYCNYSKERGNDKMVDNTAHNVAMLLKAQATDEEKVVFDKVSRADADKVLKDLGRNKDEILETFMRVWSDRLWEAIAVKEVKES